MSSQSAVRLTVAGDVSPLREELHAHAAPLGLLGWVRLMEDGTLCVHAEADPGAIEELAAWLRSTDGVHEVSLRSVRVEGHEQFAIRGVPAGVFVVQEHQATAHHFDFRLEVDGVMRSWAVPKGPSLDPAVKRFAIEVEDHSLAHNRFEGRAGRGGVIIWDRGRYEQGGRVPWPQALDRGHAVFVLHGEKLQGGFALQRTRGGEKPQWLLIKRRDEGADARRNPQSTQPESVKSGRTVEQVSDLLLEQIVGTRPDDDVALIVVRLR